MLSWTSAWIACLMVSVTNLLPGTLLAQEPVSAKQTPSATIIRIKGTAQRLAESKTSDGECPSPPYTNGAIDLKAGDLVPVGACVHVKGRATVRLPDLTTPDQIMGPVTFRVTVVQRPNKSFISQQRNTRNVARERSADGECDIGGERGLAARLPSYTAGLPGDLLILDWSVVAPRMPAQVEMLGEKQPIGANPDRVHLTLAGQGHFVWRVMLEDGRTRSGTVEVLTNEELQELRTALDTAGVRGKATNEAELAARVELLAGFDLWQRAAREIAEYLSVQPSSPQIDRWLDELEQRMCLAGEE